MKSVLNEKSALGVALDIYDDIKDSGKGRQNKRRGERYLGGSISRYTKNLLMTFPVLCDNSVPLETIMTISKAHERKMGDLLQMMFTSMNVNFSDGESAANIIKDIYSGIDPNADINDLIDLIDQIAANGDGSQYPSKYASGIKFETAQAIREMMEEFKKAAPFPYENFSERSLNEYVVKQVYNSVVVSEASQDPDPNRSPDSDQYKGAKPGMSYSPAGLDSRGRTIYKYTSVYDKYSTLANGANSSTEQNGIKNRIDAQKAKDANAYNDARNERDRKNDLIANQNTLANRNQRILTANDLKKSNEMQPLLITINYNIVEKTPNGTNVIDRKTFIAGIKARVIPVEGIDIVERFAAKNKNKLSLKNFIRATTGEISFVKDFLLCLKQAKVDARNASKRGSVSNVWHILEKRANKNSLNKMSKLGGNDASCITSVVLSRENVNYLKTAYGFDIEDSSNARMIMDNFNLLALFIADEALEMVKFMYDGDAEFESLSYTSLDREISDRNYKKMINTLNQQGR